MTVNNSASRGRRVVDRHSRESGDPRGPASCQNQDLRDYRILRIPPARVFGLAVFPVMLKAQVARSGIRIRTKPSSRDSDDFFGGRNHFLPRMPFGDGRGRRLLQPLRRASAGEMPRLRHAESARERVPLRLRQSDSRAASRRTPVQPAAAVRARPMSAPLQDERARLRVLLLMRAAPRRTAAESGRRRILLRALQAEPREVWRRRLLRERERRGAGGFWIRAC